jgi:Zn ribbon nucleic-acid-binding protein
MVLIVCEMCEDLISLSAWREGDHFICVKCAEVLSRIKQQEIKLNHIFTDKARLQLFDILRFKEVL